MKILFIHKDFPGQYLHIVRHMAQAGDEIVAIGQSPQPDLAGMRWIRYMPRGYVSGAAVLAQEIDLAIQNGQAVAEECEELRSLGFFPDIVVGHTGWGETLFVKDVWPNVPMLGYFEFFYHATGSDLDFDPEFPVPSESIRRLRTRNAINLLALEAMDWGQAPTRWQRDRYPRHYRDKITVIHEGIDTDLVRPDPAAELWLRGGLRLNSGHETITFAARSLEPYRGFHIFMRALPKVLRDLPNAHVVIVGDDGVSYGMPPQQAENWRLQLLAELEGELDLSRVHFVGRLPFRHYLTVLQISTVHVYLTYPFILSWGLLNALSAGCAVIGARTPPVEEVLDDRRNGYLIDFFDVAGLSDRIISTVKRRPEAGMREAARATIVQDFDLKTKCLPAYRRLLAAISRGDAPQIALG